MDFYFDARRRTILFLAFFLSGFCGLLYQTIWLRLAFAKFGVITPVVSVIVSVFMLGLGIGSLFGGKLIAFLKSKTKRSALLFYALSEFAIGCSAFVVPQLFLASSGVLMSTGESNSFAYLFSSSMVMALSILPWCICMGLTIPFVMEFLSEFEDDRSSFSFLYLANVLGAVAGILTTALVLIELLGFKGTLTLAATCNFLIAGTTFAWVQNRRIQAARDSKKASTSEESGTAKPLATSLAANQHIALNALILFSTGFSSMAMEVVWTRAFSTVLGTEVYSFAKLVAVYLVSTSVGSYLYRGDLKSARVRSKAMLLALTAISAFFPVIFNDARFGFFPYMNSAILANIALISIAPFCAVLGYLTPMLIDDSSNGDPVIAGRTYAINISGSIIGPLLAGYLLLPLVGAKLSLIILSLPFLILAGMILRELPRKTAYTAAILALVICAASFRAASYEEGGLIFPDVTDIILRRDHTATVISCRKGLGKHLFVNGTPMTVLAQVTKYMAHLPLAMHKAPPHSALVICFGMGTTFRSLLSWGINTTAVELVPSVTKAFGYYQADAAEILQNPQARIVIDDGRRFLNRTNETYDVITIDPPPPTHAAGSSLLYSVEFYQEIKRHLKPGGILQQWLPGHDEVLLSAVAKSLADSFKYLQGYPAIESYGVHMLASNQPIEFLDTEQILNRMPPRAKLDLGEWIAPELREKSLRQQLQMITTGRMKARKLIFPEYSARITDDRPFNEYFYLRSQLLNPSK